MNNKKRIQNILMLKRSSYLFILFLMLANSGYVQVKNIKGSIVNEKGDPLAGATVTVVGSNRAVVSDSAGNFRLSDVGPNAKLNISFTGYADQTLSTDDRQSYLIKLILSNSSLNDVVIVGYGTQRKRDVTGAVSSISASKIKEYPIVSADQALQGRIPGVQVFQTSGAPGGAVQVRIRGVNSTAGGGANQPLYVVDGVPLAKYNEGAFAVGGSSNAASPLSTLNPSDIESIEVLKDASATAIFGARAANGVVLITTKTGKKGKARIDLNTYYGIQNLRKEIPMINARERMLIVGEQRRNNGTYGTDEIDVFSNNPYLHNEGTNWQAEVFRPAPMFNVNMSVSGASDKVSYLLSGDLLKQDGIILNTYGNRASVRTNVDVQATDRFKIGVRSSLNYQWDNVANLDNNNGGLAYIFQLPPSMAIRDENGNFNGRRNSLQRGEIFGAANNANLPTTNYVADLIEEERSANRYRIVSNVFMEYKIVPSLTYRSVVGLDYMFGELRSFSPIWQRGIDQQVFMTLSESRPKNENWSVDQLLTFDKIFGKHKINAVGGFSTQRNTSKTFFVSTTGSTSNALNTLSNQTTFNGTPSGGEVSSGIVSQFFRTNYSFKNRYLLTGTVRRDGSSRFGSNYKYGIFPSVSVGWRLSEESFMENVPLFSDVKIRASYGITGNQDIGDFLYEGIVSGTSAVFGNTLVAASAPTRFSNPDIRWERNKQLDIGLEFSLLKNRLNFVIDYYSKRTDGLLADYPISAISGVGTSVTRNIGIIDNRGFEFSVNAIAVDTKDWKWNIDFNISTNKNEVVSLGKLDFINGARINRVSTFISRTQPGQPIGSFYILETDGMYTSRAEAATAPLYRAGFNIPFFAPGDYKLVDRDKNGIIDDADRVFYGSPLPDFYGGLSTSLSYKNVTLNLVSSFQYGNYIYNYPHFIASLGEANMRRDDFNNRYRPTDPDRQTSIQLPRVNTPLLPAQNFLEDGSFFRIRSLSFSYSCPRFMLDKYKVSSLRFYVQANNFFVLTKYKGWDPEVSSNGSSVLSNGYDFGAYPQAQSVVFGLNLGL
jgi:TonB-linked SusC/RagA family outer membrane protein